MLKKLTGIASEVIGTTVSADATLMSVGLDSIGLTELQNKISEHLDTELPPTLLFDHPTLESMVDALSLNYESASPAEPDLKPNVAHLKPSWGRRTN